MYVSSVAGIGRNIVGKHSLKVNSSLSKAFHAIPLLSINKEIITFLLGNLFRRSLHLELLLELKLHVLDWLLAYCQRVLFCTALNLVEISRELIFLLLLYILLVFVLQFGDRFQEIC